MWQFDNKKGPLYLQLADQIIQQLIAGSIKPGDKLPSARDLAIDAGINPNTVIQAFQELERRGISYTKRGMGTFVGDDCPIEDLKKARIEALSAAYIKDVRALGVNAIDAIKFLKETYIK